MRKCQKFVKSSYRPTFSQRNKTLGNISLCPMNLSKCFGFDIFLTIWSSVQSYSGTLSAKKAIIHVFKWVLLASRHNKGRDLVRLVTLCSQETIHYQEYRTNIENHQRFRVQGIYLCVLLLLCLRHHKAKKYWMMTKALFALNPLPSCAGTAIINSCRLRESQGRP